MASCRRWVLSLIGLLFLVASPARSNTAPAPVPVTGQTTAQYPGDDGALKRGVPWPTPRFTNHGNGTVTDNLTGLMWSQNAAPRSVSQWTTGLEFCNAYALADYADWRMPNLREMLSLVNYGNSAPPLPTGHPFIGVPAAFTYWTSTSSREDPLRAWRVESGATSIAYKDGGFSHYVWPVRGSNTLSTLAPVPVTGQTASHAPRDDGALRVGVPLPAWRFVINGDGTISDRLTGLMWTQNVRPLGAGSTWINALEACGAWTFAEHADWRLPNVRELHSLIDASAAGRLPDGHPFSGLTASQNFWSSTTSPGSTTYAYTLAMGSLGAISVALKTLNPSIPSGGAPLAWPVRGPVELPPPPIDTGILLMVR